ncbi:MULTISPECIES: DinB family protein [unclassified Sphingopyxis]|uniref:DinB family protein n=1 Tax=unclassified Sphingopyxis TaxID=2614943 RepID=UPI0007370641|nr:MULTISPECIES: DinB family protein [unclassified Sphingopyxis]KTE34020.1 damage-inducible protein DinB [Sphingopyxis sp. HIX]KTE84127.1 damage-inducible protein DinB [Sphingopyxis sp. HXXIV]
MIDNRYLRTMTRYNKWQNREAYAAAGMLSDDERRLGRGAFFGSIHATLSHLLWADRIWFSRFDLCPPPGGSIKDSASFAGDWSALTADRQAMDAMLVEWSDGFPAGPISGDLQWYSGAAGREVTAPLGVVLTQIFNHQTHHRGQVHAMLTAAGCRTADTDLFLMPPADWLGFDPRG